MNMITRPIIIDGNPHLALDVAGTGDMLLFLHGIGGCRKNWLPNLTAVADIGQAVAMDIRGYGESGDYDGAFSFDDAADDIERLMQHMGKERVHLIGLSMGGTLALHYAVRSPERVASLVLCSTTTSLSELPDDELERFLEARRSKLARVDNMRDVARTMAELVLSPTSSPEVTEEMIESLASLRRANYLKALECAARYRFAGKLDSLKMPKLVVCGGEDRVIPSEQQRLLHARLTDAQFVFLPDAGHIVNLDAPIAFNLALRQFLTM